MLYILLIEGRRGGLISANAPLLFNLGAQFNAAIAGTFWRCTSKIAVTIIKQMKKLAKSYIRHARKKDVCNITNR
jgi:hypothetical protein